MKAELINPLLESTITVLSTMAMVEVSTGKLSIKSDSKALGAVTGLIDLNGKDNHGSLAISFSEPAILYITEKMLGDKLTEVDDSVIDLVGELTNMITGSAKRIYSDNGIEFDLAIPTISLGLDKPVQHTVKGKPILLPFETEAGAFYLEFCFR